MNRYEIRCRNCYKTLGYLSLPYKYDDNNIIMATAVNGLPTPICCPTCEVKRLMEVKKE